MKYHYLLPVFLGVLLATPAVVSGQTSFSLQDTLLANPNLTSGVALAIADMNADGLDDLVRLQNGKTLIVEYQQPNGQTFSSYSHGLITNDRSWAIAVADVNNDGYGDILTGGRYDQIKVLSATDNGQAFEMAELPGAGIFAQASNFADINNDGHLDVFVCHDDGESRIWGNDGTGGFFQADNWIDMTTDPPSDNSGNYGSVWTDFDNDNDLDLYIAKCRQGVNNPDDPRRINALFVNDGQNNYSEQAAEYGLKINHQSWTADFQDIDNDGDLDCLIANHYSPLQLLENDGTGHFTDISAPSGVSAFDGYFLQGLMRDFDNDGYVDILTARPAFLLRNNGDRTFSQVPDPFKNAPNSFATGDLNHDGFVDVYASFQNNFNDPSNNPDQVFLNDGNANHFLTVQLTGAESNRSGVGARIEIHGEWGIQVREVRAGESYGISNSLAVPFGLGQDTLVPYIVVRWPSGTTDVLSDVAAGQFLTIAEGSTCNLPDFDIETDGSVFLCPGDSTTLIAPDGYTYLWNNGTNGSQLTTYQPGNFSVVILDDQGCVAASQVVAVKPAPDESPSLSVSGDSIFCEGNHVEIVSSPAPGYMWSTGETGNAITVTETGNYFVVTPGMCDDQISDTVHIEVLENGGTPDAENVTIYSATQTTLEASGNNLYWYDSDDATTPIAEGNTFTTPVLYETTTYYVEDVNLWGGEIVSAGMSEPQYNQDPLSGPSFNGQIIFDVYQPFTLKQVTVYTDLAGPRIIELLNESGELVHSLLANIPVGESIIQLNFLIEPGIEYKLTTNEAHNNSVFSMNSPALYRSNLDFTVQYPYEVPNVLSITGSNYGPSFYYYFFDWQIELPSVKCPGDRIPVTVTVEPNALDEAKPFGWLQVQPNPAADWIVLNWEAIESGPATLSLMDLTGRVLHTEIIAVQAGIPSSHPIDLQPFPAGMYVLKIRQGERIGWEKVVRQ